MATQETGKQRASRIPLDYFKHGDAISRTKLGVTAVVLVLVVAWMAAGFLRSDAGNRRFSRGPVAAVHAAWDGECAACHTPFTPLSADNVLNVLGRNVHTGDANCKTCHAGPEHHATQKAESTPSCAACHRDHRGRDALLTHTPDGQCTVCHANLKNHTREAPHYEDVARFAAGAHPEFKLLRSGQPRDPGHIKFNHKLHMTPGQVTEAGAPPWTLARIEDKGLRERYRARQEDKADNAAVKLDCASCHQLDSGDFGLDKSRQPFAGLPVDAVLPKRAAGAQMLPITYANQCKACHPLNIEVKPAGDQAARWRDLPHRVQPAGLRLILEDIYAGQFLLENKLAGDKPVPSRPLPGQRLLDPGEEKAARTFIQERVAGAERQLYRGKKTCGECHSFDPAPESPEFPRNAHGVEDWGKVAVQPSNIPDVWFRQARFDHAAHRAVNCRECHARAYPDDANASVASTDVMLPGIDNCLQCHAPRVGTGAGAKGGVRFDCVECHTYHHGDGPLQGPGARARAPDKPLGIQEFLSGR
jgi:hypothetical protein